MKQKAEAVREEVAAHYGALGYDTEYLIVQNTLEYWDESADPDNYCVTWEDGPYEWALGYTSSVPGTFCEPWNSFVLCVFNDD